MSIGWGGKCRKPCIKSSLLGGFWCRCLALSVIRYWGAVGDFCLHASPDETARRVLGTEGSGRKHAAPKLAGAGGV